MAAEDRQILGLVAGATMFQNSLKAIKDQRLRATIVATLRSVVLLRLDELPRKLHFHPLTGKPVQSAVEPGRKVNAWSLHVTPDDRYKASFTFEGGVMYMRLVDEHDVIDKRP